MKVKIKVEETRWYDLSIEEYNKLVENGDYELEDDDKDENGICSWVLCDVCRDLEYDGEYDDELDDYDLDENDIKMLKKIKRKEKMNQLKKINK